MIITVLGGIRIPNVPPAAMHPVASESSYLKRFISGSATMPMVAAAARDDPDMAAKPPQAPTVAMLSPPGRKPIHRYTVWYISKPILE